MSAPRTTGTAPATTAPPTPGQLAGQVVTVLEADPRLTARSHAASDVDGSPLAQHHTLGGDARQAAPGNHGHTGYAEEAHSHDVEDLPGAPRSWVASSSAATAGIVLATAETKDAGVGDLAFTAVAGRRYHFAYTARALITLGAAPTVVDIRLRATTGAPPASPTNTSGGVGAHSQPIHAGSGSGACSFTANSHRDCPGDIAAGDWLVAAFYDVTAGTGTIALDTPSLAGSRRELVVKEEIPG